MVSSSQHTRHLHVHYCSRIPLQPSQQRQIQPWSSGWNMCPPKLFHSHVYVRRIHHIQINSKKAITTKGWTFEVYSKDRSYNWIPLSQLKESNPIELAEYSYSCNLNKEPAFNWRVSKILRKRDCLIHKMKSYSMRELNMKLWVDVPTTFEGGIELDRLNNTTCWKKQ